MQPPLLTPNAARDERRAALLSLGVGVVLLCAKFFAYFLTGSAAIFSDALETIVNVLASLFALYAIILAHAPADEDHPYGHGKVEFLAAAFEGGMILLAALVIAERAVAALIYGADVQKLGVGLIIVGASLVINGAAGMNLIHRGRKSGSMTLEADGKHLMTDAVSSAMVLLTLGLVRLTGKHWLDPLGALAVAGYITWAGGDLVRRAAWGLMDRQDVADDNIIRGILESHLAPQGKPPHICSYHKLRHRHSGRYHWVDFHIVVPAEWNIQQGHSVASTIEYEIECALGEGNATAHVEPCDETGCPRCETIRTVASSTTAS